MYKPSDLLSVKRTAAAIDNMQKMIIENNLDELKEYLEEKLPRRCIGAVAYSTESSGFCMFIDIRLPKKYWTEIIEPEMLNFADAWKCKCSFNNHSCKHLRGLPRRWRNVRINFVYEWSQLMRL